MSDVSCRAFSWFQACARAGLISIDDLLEGSPVPRSTLERPTARVRWDDWAALCDRFATLIGSEEALEATGELILDSELAGPLVGIAGMLTDPVDLYRVGFRFVGPMTYKNLEFGLERLPHRELRARVAIPEPYRGCRPWMIIAVGALRALPRFLGATDTVVVREVLDDRRLVVRLRPPPSRSIFHRIGTRLSGITGHDALVRELEFQQRQLSESWQALERSEHGFRAALEALPAGVAIHHGGKLRLANPALRALLGMESGESLPAWDLADRAVPRDRATWKSILDGHAPGHHSVGLLRADGSTVDVLARGVASVTFDGHPAGLVLVVDRSEEVRALHEAARSERLVHALHEALPDLVLRLDGDVLVEVHAGRDHPDAMSMLTPLVGTNLFEVVRHFAGSIQGSDATTSMLATLERAQRERTPVVVRFAVDHMGPLQLEARFIPLPEREAVVLVRDVTELTRLQEELTLSARMTSVGTLAAGVAHEVNNPLTYVESNLELAIEQLSSGSHDPTAVIDGLQEALEGTRRVGQIVRQLGDLSRPLAPQPARVDLAEAASRALSLTGNELRHRAQVERRFAAAPPAWADPQQVVQVLVNLLINAAQAIEPGNVAGHRITVAIDTDEEGRPRVRIVDTGIGMTPEVRSRIFDPFFTTKHGAGSGLGLAISQRLVTAAGGSLSVESEPGRGSTLTLVLPRAEGQAQVASEDREAIAPRRSRLLIVDDDPPVGRALVRSLGDHDATWVPSVEAALAEVSTNPPDLVICDVMMPDRSGMDFFEAACAARPELRSRIVFLSGGVFVPGDESRVRESGCPVWNKPISPDELRRRVAAMLRDAQ